MNIAGLGITNPEAATTPTPATTYANGQWGYRLRLQSSTLMELETVGPNNAFNTFVVPPGNSSTWDITTQESMTAAGAHSGTVIDTLVSTLFAVYWCEAGDFASGLGFSTQAPIMFDGLYRLGNAGDAYDCLFLGWVFISAAGLFTDSVKDRHVVNYWNRRWTHLEVDPNYNNNNAATTYFRTAAAWTTMTATAATSQFSFIANGEDSVWLQGTWEFQADTVQVVFGGIGITATTPLQTCCFPNLAAAVQSSCSCSYSYLPGTAALVTVSQLCLTGGAAVVFYADNGRLGSASDPPATCMRGLIRA